MANPERSGIVEGYKKFNETTRNIGLGVFGVAWLVGASGIATVAAISVIVDQAQIMIIDAWQKRKMKRQMATA